MERLLDVTFKYYVDIYLIKQMLTRCTLTINNEKTNTGKTMDVIKNKETYTFKQTAFAKFKGDNNERHKRKLSH